MKAINNAQLNEIQGKLHELHELVTKANGAMMCNIVLQL